ncbi:MAG: NAD-dependent epimerase/dehydratase family protein [Bdellovibrionales bacterium]|nr:NAD-dependent epimerase/dehydratase family protein [Bdellovibrionales bacterium]
MERMDRRTWLVTGAAGFIGSHLVGRLLGENQKVVGVDNLSTGRWENLQQVLGRLTNGQQKSFSFICDDVGNVRMMERALRGVHVVLHQAAVASVPLSIENPHCVHDTNVTGFLNILNSARNEGVKRVVYASSSAVYGDNPTAIKSEGDLGQLLSPYAVTKFVDELYAAQFHRHYEMETLGLRYFNVYGPRQDPQGAYAAVIPKWIEALRKGDPILIHGDGTTTRDFCHVDDVVAANILGATVTRQSAFGKSYNICSGEETTLSSLAEGLVSLWSKRLPQAPRPEIHYGRFRDGDIYRSCGSYELARKELGFNPRLRLSDGLIGLFDNLGDQ